MIDYRDMNALDVPVVASMERAIYPDAPWSVGQFKEEIAGVPRNRYYIVATNSKSEIVGYAGVFAPGGAEADVLTVGVVPMHRGQGIARELMARITKWAVDQGSIAMMLEVKTDNVEAISLYESLGYSKLNIRKDYFGSGLDALVMRKELA